MERFVIQVPDKKVALVQQLLKELGVKIRSGENKTDRKQPNKLTAKTIDNARKGIDLDKSINNISDFMNSI